MNFKAAEWIGILENPAKIYLCLGFLFGLVFLFVTPPCSIPDEPTHFVRIFKVAQGDMFSATEVKLPSLDAYCDLCELIGMNRNPQNSDKQLKEFLAEPGVPLSLQEMPGSYPPVPYLPAALAVKVLSWFQPSAAVYLYSARMVTFLTALCITYYAISIMPFGKWVMLILALLPMRLYMMASFSPDAVTTALAVLWIALVSGMAVSKADIVKKEMLTTFLIGMLLAFSKPMYLILLPLVFAVPLRYLSRKTVAVRLCLLILGLCVVFAAGIKLREITVCADKSNITTNGFQKSGKDVNPGQASGTAGSLYFLAAVNPKAQLAYLIENPARAVEVFVNGFKISGAYIPKACIGLFGWFNIVMAKWFYWLAFLVLIISLSVDNKYNIPARYRFVSISLFLLAMLIIPLSAYLLWTPVGSNYFHGVHGRYFIPFMPLLFLSLAGMQWRFIKPDRDKLLKISVLCSVAVLSMASAVKIYGSYYNLTSVKGFIEIDARSNANGIANLYIKEDNQQGKDTNWKHEGMINIVKSDEVLSYQIRLVGKPVKAIRLDFAATGMLDIEIYKMEVKDLSGKHIRSIAVDRVSCDISEAASLNQAGKGGVIPFAIRLSKKHPLVTVIYQDVPFRFTP